MEFSHSAAQADVFAEKTFESLQSCGLSKHPVHYVIWYAYHCDGVYGLKAAMDEVIKKHKIMDEKHCRDIFDRFFTSRDHEMYLQKVENEYEQAMGKLIGFIKETEDETHSYGQALDHYGKELSGDVDKGNLKNVLKGIITKTQEMQEQNKKLEKQLSSSTQEIQSLRSNLTEVRKEALTDGLTGIGNRRCFDIQLREFAIQATHGAEQLCLLFIDIDHFKKFNDTYGHPMGDQVLKLLGKTLRDLVSKNEFPARYGGEEFAVIVPHQSLEKCRELGEKIRESIATKKLTKRTTGEDLGKISISVGVTQFKQGEPINDFIQRADMALYRAKGKGRNCVVVE